MYIKAININSIEVPQYTKTRITRFTNPTLENEMFVLYLKEIVLFKQSIHRGRTDKERSALYLDFKVTETSMKQHKQPLF